MVCGSFALVMIMALLAIVASKQARTPPPGKPHYPTIYGFINIDAYLKNDGLRDETYHCVLGDGPCTSAFAAFYAKYGPEVIKTNCARCTPRQKKVFLKARKWYLENRPEEYYAYLRKIYGVDAQKPHTPKPHTEKPHTEKFNTEKRHAEKPHTQKS